MKLNFIGVVVILLFLNSCSTNAPEIDLKSFFKRWQVDYIELNGKKVMHLHSGDEEFDYEFKKDNTYIIYSASGDHGIGNWELNKTENCIYIRNHQNEIYGKIISIKSDEMILTPISKIGENPNPELTKYHYIPK